MSTRKNIVITGISIPYDGGSDPGRWKRPRPTIMLCQSPELRVDQLYLRTLVGQESLALQLAEDIREVSPETEVLILKRPTNESMSPECSFEEFYTGNYNFFSSIDFDYQTYDYYYFFQPGRGITLGFAVLAALSYLNIKCKFLHIKGEMRSKPDISDIHLISYDASFSQWLEIIRRYNISRISAKQILTNNVYARNRHYNDLITKIEHVVTHSKSPVLLSGETGTGKTYLARNIYELKRKIGQCHGRFVEVNCGTMHGELAISTLFGHVKGAFTGALANRDGLLLSAHNGMIFLDEIGELPLQGQILLLKAIDEKRFTPLGADKEVESDFQLICATNRDLKNEVRKGGFRLDLYSRISTWEFYILPLRNRPEDVEPNFNALLNEYNIKNNENLRISSRALKKYVDFALAHMHVWDSGNLRTMRASLERMAPFCQGGVINESVVEEECAYLLGHNFVHYGKERFSRVKAMVHQSVYEAMDLFELIQLEGVLEVCGEASSRSEAGRLLFAASRTKKKGRHDDTSRLKAYLGNYGLSWEDIKKKESILSPV